MGRVRKGRVCTIDLTRRGRAMPETAGGFAAAPTIPWGAIRPIARPAFYEPGEGTASGSSDATPSSSSVGDPASLATSRARAS